MKQLIKRPYNGLFLFLLAHSALASLCFTAGCRDTSKRDVYPSDPTIPQNIVHSSEIEAYALSEAECKAASEVPDQIQSVDGELWQDGDTIRASRDVSNLHIKTSPISSTAVSGVNMNAVFQRFCDAKVSAPPNCAQPSNSNVGWRQISSGTSIKACHGEMSPPRGSIEHIALSAIVAIESASRALKTLLPDGTNIPPLTILVVPRFESHWMPWSLNGKEASYEQILAENLSYFPNTSTTPPYIAILPKRTSSVETVNLWETAFPIAHEFGHHVERSMRLDHFDKKRSILRTAVSEGFADVIAFTSLEFSSQSLKGIPCMGVDRAPDELEFSSGTAKILDQPLLARVSERSDIMFQEFQTGKPCQGTLPASAHGIGAIFARWLLEFSSYTPTYQDAHAKTLTAVATEWLTQVESRIGAGGNSPEKDLEQIVRALEAVMKRQFAASGTPLTENIKALLRQKIGLAFPTLKDRDWFVD